MVRNWQVVRSSPGQYSNPEELSALWESAVRLDVPAPVASLHGVGDIDDFDDFDWWHRSTVDAEESVCIDFHGLTFPATVFVDGIPVSECESMFLPVRVELTAGHHEVCVCFRSLNRWLQTRRPRGRWRSSLVAAAGLRWARTTLLGRAPVYGNVPAPVGFWRSVSATPARLKVDVSVVSDPGTGAVELTGVMHSASEAYVDVAVHGPSGELVAAGSCVSSEGRFSFSAQIDDPQLWWPRGYGPHNVYRAVVHIKDRVVAQRTFGFRTVAATTDGGGFQIRVNDVPVFCRGVTWSPPNPVRLDADESELREQLTAFGNAGANMVRVVGGLVYEQDEFWEQCARLGLMVWQDAMQATFDPPAEVSELIARELAEVLTSVSGNPALTVVSGGSETLQRPEMLGLEQRDFRMPILDELLPRVVAEHARVPYVRASPAPPPGTSELAIRPDTGVAHWFGVGGYLRPISDVRSAGVRFAAECLAFANPPSAHAVERHFGSAAVAGHHPSWKAEVPRDRGSSWDFEDVRDFYVRELFGEDPLAVRRVDPERYLQLGRLAVAEAMLQCFAYWRRTESGCSGALVLAGKDLRPGAGWGLLDVDGDPKLALEALRRVWAPVAVILTDGGLSGLRIDLFNDTPDRLDGELVLSGTNSLGQRTIEAKRSVSLAGRSSLTLFDSDLSGAFCDLSHAFRFGQPTADGVEVIVQIPGTAQGLRDALIVKPRPGQANSGLKGIARRCDADHWNLEVSSDVALRFVSVDTPGWLSSDNHFHLPAATPYTVRLRRCGDRATPAGRLTSMDSLGSGGITVDA